MRSKQRLQFLKDMPGVIGGRPIIYAFIFMVTVERGPIVIELRRILELPLHPQPDLGSVRSRRENNQ